MNNQLLNCACVIHGTGYDWSYVDRLYRMIQRHTVQQVVLHVYTESGRPVPAPYVKHALDDWGIQGPKKSWWYKIQLFNPDHYSGLLLYFDLDTVITANIDWVTTGDPRFFWAIKDFKHLWKPTHLGINSSLMYWDTTQYSKVWEEFVNKPLNSVIKQWPGDQDFISHVIPKQAIRYFDSKKVKSWRWQCLDGGYDFKRKRHLNPESGTKIDADTAIMIFHGKPKPHEIKDSTVLAYWV